MEIELEDEKGSSTTMAPQSTQRAGSRRGEPSRQYPGAESRSARQRLNRRAPNVIRQTDAPVELRTISTPPGEPETLVAYDYYSEPGAGSTIYIFDSGANPSNIVSNRYL